MASIKTMSMEFGREFTICSVTMDNGDSAKVVGIICDDGSKQWRAESGADEATEDFALAVVRKCFDGIVDVITGD